MAVLPICTWGDPVLQKKTRKLAEITPEIKRLVQDLLDTLHAQNGLGLAANQVGRNERICVIEIPVKVGSPEQYVLINAERVSQSKTKAVQEEGCLSFPGIFTPVERPLEIEIRALDLKGKPLSLKGTGLLGRALQHELDHLDGILFVERMSMVKRVMLKRQLREIAKQTQAALRGNSAQKF